MKGATTAGAAFLTVLVLVAVAERHRVLEQDIDPRAVPSPATAPSTALTEKTNQGNLYGRVTTDDGAIYEGRLRFGGDEEAFWDNYFNGFKDENPWATHAALEQLTQKRRPIEIFGFAISLGERQIDLGRPLMARFGDIARIEARGRDLWVTLKSGTVFHLDRFAADDFADGLRVWDGTRGVVDLDEWRIRSIELLPTARLEAAPDRLHGTVRTAHGDFRGFIQWDREECVGSDELVGHTADGELSLRFDTIRSIARRSRDSALVTQLDGREIELSDTREVGQGHPRDLRRRPPLQPSAGLLGRIRAHRLQRRRQRARLHRFSARAPAHRKRHHPRRSPPHRPAGIRPRRERDHRDARCPVPGRGLHHPLRPDRLDRTRRPRRARPPARPGDAPWRRGIAARAHR